MNYSNGTLFGNPDSVSAGKRRFTCAALKERGLSIIFGFAETLRYPVIRGNLKELRGGFVPAEVFDLCGALSVAGICSLLRTSIFNSGENQVSVTTVMSRLFPSVPAGITRVVRRPSAYTPSMVSPGSFSIVGRG